MRRYGLFVAIALAVGIALPLVGCPLIVLKLCLINDTPFTMDAAYMTPSINGSWGANLLSASVASGGRTCVSGISPDTYDLRAEFDVRPEFLPQPSTNIVYVPGIGFKSKNVKVTFDTLAGELVATQEFFLKEADL